MQGAWCRVQSSGFRFQDSGFRVEGNLDFRFQGSGFRFLGSAFRVQGSGFRLQISDYRVWGSGFMVQDVPERSAFHLHRSIVRGISERAQAVVHRWPRFRRRVQRAPDPVERLEERLRAKQGRVVRLQRWGLGG